MQWQDPPDVPAFATAWRFWQCRIVPPGEVDGMPGHLELTIKEGTTVKASLHGTCLRGGESKGLFSGATTMSGTLVLHATHDPKETTRKARDAFAARFEREVDPDGLLAPAERARRAEAARRAYFTGLALRSSQVRRRRKR